VAAFWRAQRIAPPAEPTALRNSECRESGADQLLGSSGMDPSQW
jgi:hypothetical protein